MNSGFHPKSFLVILVATIQQLTIIVAVFCAKPVLRILHVFTNLNFMKEEGMVPWERDETFYSDLTIREQWNRWELAVH